MSSLGMIFGQGSQGLLCRNVPVNIINYEADNHFHTLGLLRYFQVEELVMRNSPRGFILTMKSGLLALIHGKSGLPLTLLAAASLLLNTKDVDMTDSRPADLLLTFVRI